MVLNNIDLLCHSLHGCGIQVSWILCSRSHQTEVSVLTGWLRSGAQCPLPHSHGIWLNLIIIVGHRFLSSGWPSAIDSSQLVEAAHRFLSCGLLQSMAVTSLRMTESICFSFKSLWLLLSLSSKLLFQRAPQNGSSHSYSRELHRVYALEGNSYFLRAPRKSQEATLGFFLPCDLYFLFLRDLCPFQKWWKLFQFLFFFPLFFAMPQDLLELSSSARDWTQAMAVKALSPNPWTSRKLPMISFRQLIISRVSI